MAYWCDWLTREAPVLAGLNVIVAGVGMWSRVLNVTLPPYAAIALALLALAGLSVLNFMSARRHAPQGKSLLWPLAIVLESLAVGATWSIWSLGVAA